MKIYLIGMPASGKSIVGKKLAEKLNYKYIDLNSEIEKSALMFLEEILIRYNAQSINKEETNLLKTYENLSNVVIATNDQVVLTRRNKELLKGNVVFLDVETSILEKRIETPYQNLVLESITLDEMGKERYLKYRNFSTIIIDNNNKSVSEVVDKIIGELKLN